MAVVDELQIIVDAKVSKAVADLKKTQKQTKNLASSAKKLVKSLLPITGAAMAFHKLAKFTAESAKAASDAQEITSKYNTIFKSVANESEAMAKQLADDFGLAGSTAMELLGNTGDLLTGFGLTAGAALELSDQTNRLAVDLASFSNAQGGAAAVSAALTSAYTGEREALKTYGIVISEEMVKTEMLKQATEGLTFASEQQAKISATLALAQKQSTNAIGDYSRTSDSAANVTKRLNEEIKESKEIFGDFVLKSATPLKSALIDLISKMNEAAIASRDLREALDIAKTGKDVDQTSAGVEILKAGISELKKEQERYNIVVSKYGEAAAGWQKQSADAAREAIGLIDDQIAAAELQIALIKDKIKAEGEATEKEKADAAADAERSKAKKEAADAAKKDLDNLIDAYGETEQGARDALIAQIAYFETFKDGPMAKAVLADLKAELDGLSGGAEKAKLDTEEIMAELQSRGERRIGLQRQHEIMLAKMEQERIDAGVEAEEQAAEYKKQVMDSLVSNMQSVMSSISSIISNSYQARIDSAEGNEEKQKELMREQAEAEKKWAIFQAVVNTAAAVTKALSAAPPPYNLALAGLSLAAGTAQIAAIQSAPVPAFASGGDFTTNGPQMIMVGDNPGGRERVRIDPQNDNRGDGQSINIRIENVYGPGGAEGLAKYIVEAIKRGQRSGRVEAWS